MTSVPSDTDPTTHPNANAKFFVLGAVFLDMIGIGIAFPTFPILIGGYTHSAAEQAQWYAILMGAFSAMQFLFAPFMGALSDRVGRRPVLLVTIGGLAFHYLLIATAPTLWLLLGARLLGGVTGASFTTASAYLADVSKPEDRAKSFGMIGAAFGLGFIIGPLLGGWLSKYGGHFPFYVAASFSAVNCLYGYIFVKESLPPERRTKFSFAKANPFGAIFALVRRHALGTFVIGFAILSLAQNVMILGWVLYTQHRFHWGAWENGILLCVVGVLAAIVQGGLTGILVKRFGERRLAILSLITSVVTNILYGLASEPWMMFAILIAGSIGFVGGPAIQGIISKTTAPEVQGVTMGALQSLNSLSTAIAPWIAGSVLTYVVQFPPNDIRVGASFFLVAALNLIALVVIWVHLRKTKPVANPATLGDFR